MIPTLLAVGFAVGGVANRFLPLHLAVFVLIVVALGWGILVGTMAGDFAIVGGGALLGAANAGAGAAAGSGLALLIDGL